MALTGYPLLGWSFIVLAGEVHEKRRRSLSARMPGRCHKFNLEGKSAVVSKELSASGLIRTSRSCPGWTHRGFFYSISSTHASPSVCPRGRIPTATTTTSHRPDTEEIYVRFVAPKGPHPLQRNHLARTEQVGGVPKNPLSMSVLFLLQNTAFCQENTATSCPARGERRPGIDASPARLRLRKRAPLVPPLSFCFWAAAFAAYGGPTRFPGREAS